MKSAPPKTCFFGIAAHTMHPSWQRFTSACQKRATWQSTFKGKRIEMYWCGEHKPESTSRIHGVRRLLKTNRKPATPPRSGSGRHAVV